MAEEGANEINIPPSGKLGSEPSRPDKTSHREERRINREDQREGVIHAVFIWTIRGIAICLGIMFLVRVWHFVAPYGLHWLCPEQIETLDRFLFSGLVGAVVGKYIDLAMSPGNDKQ